MRKKMTGEMKGWVRGFFGFLYRFLILFSLLDAGFSLNNWSHTLENYFHIIISFLIAGFCFYLLNSTVSWFSYDCHVLEFKTLRGNKKKEKLSNLIDIHEYYNGPFFSPIGRFLRFRNNHVITVSKWTTLSNADELIKILEQDISENKKK